MRYGNIFWKCLYTISKFCKKREWKNLATRLYYLHRNLFLNMATETISTILINEENKFLQYFQYEFVFDCNKSLDRKIHYFWDKSGNIVYDTFIEG